MSLKSEFARKFIQQKHAIFEFVSVFRNRLPSLRQVAHFSAYLQTPLEMLLFSSILQYINKRAMSLFGSMTYLTAFANKAKQTMRNLTQTGPNCNESPELKPQKGAINDTTMESIAKLDENSHLYTPFEDNSFSRCYSSKKKQSQNRAPGLFSLASQKRHEDISYFDANGKKLCPNEGDQLYSEQMGQNKKRALSLAGETYEHEAKRLLNKYINKDGIPLQREDNYLEMESQMANGTIKHINDHINDDDKEDQTVIKISFRKKPQQEPIRKNNCCIRTSDLPNIGDYSINYTMKELAQMTYEQISSLQKLAISTQWGKLQFLKPVSLYRKDLEACLTLETDCIEIYDEEWEKQPFQLVVFDKYKSMNALKSIKKQAFALGLTKMKETESSELLIFRS